MNKNRLVLIVALIFVCTTISAQEILNITKIPNYIVSFETAKDIIIEDDKFIVPIHGAENNIYEYLPAMEADSFEIPNYVFLEILLK